MKKSKNNLKKKLTKKFRLVVLNESSFEERFSLKLTRLNVFVFGGVFSVLLVGITVFIIAFTPIKEYIPGYSSTKLKRQASNLFYRVDSLQAKLNVLAKFTEAIRPILVGSDTVFDVSLPYKNVQVDYSNSLDFPVRNDSISKLIAKVRVEIDSTYKAFYKRETDLMQIKHQEFQVSSQDLHNKNIEGLKETYVSKIEKQKDSIRTLNVDFLTQKEKLSGLEKKLALKELESKRNLKSLSKENQDFVAFQNKNTEKIRKEVSELYRLELKSNEKKIRAAYEIELNALNDSLFNKDSIIASLMVEITASQKKKIGELANEIPFKEVDASSEKLLMRSLKDSIFREDVERQDRFSLFDFETIHNDKIVFFAPVKGIVTDSYNVKDKHFAVDIAVTKGTGVKAIADGTIVFAEWTAGTGYVLIIEHANKYISVYKHNEVLYRDQGDLVKSGEVISMAGSSGEYSTGHHLHFEMWYQGYSVNPVNFIEFE
jgi:murein DD-endopeptidase MepM/ murein hydrolase activator NlpD